MARVLAPVLLGIPALIVSSRSHGCYELGPIGHDHLPDSPRLQTKCGPWHDRRLPLHAGEPSSWPRTRTSFPASSSLEAPRITTRHSSSCHRRSPQQQNETTDGGRGWTCFGLPLPSSDVSGLGAVPLLTFWAPGAGVDNFPKGSGITLPAGSQVVMQVHYNLLVGDRPVKNKLILHTVPASTPLLPLHLDLMLAPPDIPCPAGVTGPLCNRAASLANLGQRFGQIGSRRGQRHRSTLWEQSV